MPHLTLDDLSKKVSSTVVRLNPELFARVGRMGASQHSKPARALEQETPPKHGGKTCPPKGIELCITLVAHVPRRMDDDNLAHACKPLRDAIAEAIGIDDGDRRLRWEYGQVETRGHGGVCVKVEVCE